MEEMTVLLNNPRYIYADILIALADADDEIVENEKEFLDDVFSNMGLDKEVVKKMWLTPRTMDVIESLLEDIEDTKFKSNLLKDCFLLAYADDDLSPEESRFIQKIKSSLKLGETTEGKIKAWVEKSIELQKEAADLF